MALTFRLDPADESLNFARSPNQYRITSTNSLDPILLDVFIWTSAPVPGTPDFTLSKYTDAYGGVTFDVSQLCKSELITVNIDPPTPNNMGDLPIVHLDARASQSGETMIYGDTVHAVYGYKDYGIAYNSYSMNPILSSLDPDPFVYEIPDNSHYAISYTSGSYVNVKLTGEVSGASTSFNFTASNYADVAEAANFISTFNCGYYDLINSCSIDFDDEYSVHFQDVFGHDSKVYNFKKTFEDDDFTTLTFLNKFGVWDYLYFQGRKDTADVFTSETYNTNPVILTATAISYNKHRGQKGVLSKQGVNQMVLNSGWQQEEVNPRFEELFMSEHVFDFDTGLPWIITDKSLAFKTHQNHRMINYIIKLDAAFNIGLDVS
jgi:hypothetical protein